MKLQLPHKTYSLNMDLEIEDRKKEIDNILAEVIEFHESSMSVEDYFRYTWNKQPTKIAMDIIGYYLSKETKNLNVLSNDKQKEMIKGSPRHTTFSGMGYENQIKVGIIDIDDSNYN